MLRKGTQIFFVCIVESGRKERSSCRNAKQKLHRLHDNSRRTFQAEKQKKTFLDCETEDKQLKLKRQRTEKWQKRHSEGRTLGQVMASHPWIQKKEMNKLGQMIISVFHNKLIWSDTLYTMYIIHPLQCSTVKMVICVNHTLEVKRSKGPPVRIYKSSSRCG